jgi:NitT/TauT family transport system ATP-binding protein
MAALLAPSSVPRIAADPRPLVRLDRVSKRAADGTLLLQDLSFEIGEQDIVCLLGPAGCGKSMTLRLLAGLERATTGKSTWAAQRTLGASRTDRELGWVTQDAALMPWGTVFDNVHLPLRLSGVSREQADETVRDALATVGMTQFAEAHPLELSPALQLRVAIARAMVTHPRLVLMDEPFAALDEPTRQRLHNELLALWREHRFAIVMASRSVHECVYLGSRILLMAARPGRVVREMHIGEPYPRHGVDFPASHRYAQHVRNVQRELHGTHDGWLSHRAP